MLSDISANLLAFMVLYHSETRLVNTFPLAMRCKYLFVSPCASKWKKNDDRALVMPMG